METTRISKMKFLNQTGAAKHFPVTVVRSSLAVVLMSAITTLTASATSYLYTFQDENVHHTVLGCWIWKVNQNEAKKMWILFVSGRQHIREDL